MAFKRSGSQRRGASALLIVLLSWSLVLPQGYAQSFASGYKKYFSGDMSGAERAFSGALRKRQKASEKAKTLKFLGITQYNQGKKALAQRSFQAALKVNPRTSISKSEVLDESVIGFFKKIAASAKPARRPALASAAPRPTRKAKTTQLRIISNVRNASIMLDGILAGSVGSVIEASPGSNTITVTSPGYIGRKVKVKIAKNMLNTITVNLKKPKPKPKPKPKKKRRSRGGAAAGLAAGSRLPSPGGEELFGDSGAGNAADPSLAGRDLTSEFQLESGGSSYPPQQAPAPQAYQPPPAYGQPTYPQQPYAQPVYPAPVYPTAPVYPQPAYPQPYAQPAYPQPYAQPTYPQQPYAQPTVPPAPPAPPSAAPAPQIANDPQPPPGDYYSDPVSEPAADPFSSGGVKKKKKKRRKLPPPVSYSSGKKKKKKSRSSRSRRKKRRSSKSSSEWSMFIALSPFGAGQYQNGNYLMGGLMTAGQLGALFYYYDQHQSANAEAAEAEAIIAADCNTEDADRTAECEKFSEDTAASVAAKRQQRLYAGIFGAALWAGGATMAVMNKPKKKKRRTRRKRRFGLNLNYQNVLLAEADLTTEELLLERIAARKSYDSVFDLGILTPVGGRQDELGIAIKWEKPL